MTRGQRRSPKPLRRRVEIRAPRRTLAVFCEGQRTEPEYLEALRRDSEVRIVAAVDLRIESPGEGSVPMKLVKMAIAARERASREEAEIDEFWCVFDVEWPEHHPALSEATELADKNGIKLAVSNPCFELWLALHFVDHKGFLDNDGARRLRRSHDGQAGKGLSGARYMPLRKVAAQRAAVLERLHSTNGTKFPHDNPSSGMHRLIVAVTPRQEIP